MWNSQQKIVFREISYGYLFSFAGFKIWNSISGAQRPICRPRGPHLAFSLIIWHSHNIELKELPAAQGCREATAASKQVQNLVRPLGYGTQEPNMLCWHRSLWRRELHRIRGPGQGLISSWIASACRLHIGAWTQLGRHSAPPAEEHILTGCVWTDPKQLLAKR